MFPWRRRGLRTDVVITNDGMVIYSPQEYNELFCENEVPRNFTNGEEFECDMKFGSWTYSDKGWVIILPDGKGLIWLKA